MMWFAAARCVQIIYFCEHASSRDFTACAKCVQIVPFHKHTILLPCAPTRPSSRSFVRRSVRSVCPSRLPVRPPIRRLALAQNYRPRAWATVAAAHTPRQQSLLGSPDQLKTLSNRCWNPTSAPWPLMSPSLTLKTNKNKNRTLTLPSLTTTW